MKKAISVLLLFSLLSSSYLGAQPASSLGEEILSDLLSLNIQIENLRQQLESLERKSQEKDQTMNERELLMLERERLMNEKEGSTKRKEALLNQLSALVDEQAAAYRASLKKWKFSTLSLSILSAALAGIAIYQGASK